MPRSPDGTRGLQLVTGMQRAAIAAYTGVGYERINEGLRTDVAQDIPHVAQLDAAIAASPVTNPMVVYRGIGPDLVSVLEETGLYAGTELVDRGFISTSRSLDEAIKFSERQKGGMVMRITIPSGARALDVSNHSNCPEEQEVLLARGSRLRVIGFDDVFGIIEMELVNERV